MREENASLGVEDIERYQGRTFFFKMGVAAGVFLLVWLLMWGQDPKERAVAAVFATAVALWITEAMPLAVTALLSTTLLVVLGAASAKDAFGAYGDPIIMLFIGSFMMARSMFLSGLDRRLAFMLLKRQWATASASRTLASLGVIACVISLFVSNTATTAMLLPIGIMILAAIGVEKRGDPTAVGFLLMLTWGSSIAVGTVVGTPPNLIGVKLISEATGKQINFVEWALFAMPITIAMLIAAWLVLRLMFQSKAPPTAAASVLARNELEQMGPLTPAQRNTLIAFFTALTLWVLPGLLTYALGEQNEIAKIVNERITESVAAIIGALLLFVLPCEGSEVGRAMTWKEAAKIDWGTILLFGGGIALGQAAFNTGLAEAVGHSLSELSGADTVWTITALATALAILVSEIASNTAAANTVIPVAIGIAMSAGVNPIPAAIGATIGANLGFMLPISTPPNAIVYSSGLLPAAQMMRTGLLFDVIGFGLTMICLRLILPPLGLA